ncbi:hypothetical protein [Paenibacillus agri]|uniref:DUF2007 domain-containing protein n=1 Tax=Paenibacillus agri TaxID=2744309 RepID=A0A850ETH1_9BACL|nr:hypothetical protein [Paenibacillus agri]NUU62634.1 hypothetical protein [Paenibacillus agri]
MSLLRSILDFFIPRERFLLYTTFDQMQYLKVKNHLLAEGIPHRSKIDGGSAGLNQRTRAGGRPNPKYELYVRKEDEHRALQGIR